jgi:hypothetical protein
MSTEGRNRALAFCALALCACGADGSAKSAARIDGMTTGGHAAPASQPAAAGQPAATGQPEASGGRPATASSASGGAHAGSGAAGAAADEAPTGVVFDWPETDPTRGVRCQPGHYVGEFSCDLRIIAEEGMPAFTLGGSVDMQLEETENGEILRIANGKFVGTAAVAIPSWADIVGELDCTSGRFDGRLENGGFSVALGSGIPFTDGTFMGDLGADYDRENAAMINGAWNMVGELDGFPGSCRDGTWNAALVP